MLKNNQNWHQWVTQCSKFRKIFDTIPYRYRVAEKNLIPYHTAVYRGIPKFSRYTPFFDIWSGTDANVFINIIGSKGRIFFRRIFFIKISFSNNFYATWQFWREFSVKKITKKNEKKITIHKKNAPVWSVFFRARFFFVYLL